MKKYLAYFSIGIFLFGAVYFTYIKRTKGFSYNKIHSHYTYDHRWDFGMPTEEQRSLIDQVTSKPLTFLGSGKECYAFVSEDGEYVIKFFKQKHMKTEYILNHLPLSQEMRMLQKEVVNRHLERRKKIYQSYQLAYERLQEETGVLYLHLTKTNYLKQSIHLITKSGEKFTLKLDNIEFLLQRRGTQVFDYLSAYPEKGKETINALLNLITIRNQKGIGDADINCEKNLGLLNGKGFQIDVGEFYPSLPCSPSKEELITATLDLKHYLEMHLPDLALYLDQEIEKYH